MHESVFYFVLAWHAALGAALAVFATRSRGIDVRALALDTAALVLIAALAVVAIHRKRAGYLDIALVAAMLSFAQTVATARLVERRKDLS